MVGGGRGQAHRLDVSAYCHPSCHRSHPSQLHCRPSHAPFHPTGALSAPPLWSQPPARPAGTREGTTQCPRQITRAATWGIGGQSQAPSSSISLHLSPLLQPPHQPREAPTQVGGWIRGAAPGPGSHFLAQSLSPCGKLLKVIKHPEVVKRTVNEVLINTPQEKIKRHTINPHRKREVEHFSRIFCSFGRRNIL